MKGSGVTEPYIPKHVNMQNLINVMVVSKIELNALFLCSLKYSF